jgi:DNA-binding beta-propeller fold protein YncE
MSNRTVVPRPLVFTAIFVVSQLIAGPAAATPGDTIWTATYSSDEMFEYAIGAVLAPDGSRLYVTGYQGDGRDEDFATVAYNVATGKPIWVSTYDADRRRDRTTAIAVDPDGSRVYVTGVSPGAGTQGDYATVAYNTTSGQEVWVARYDGPADKPDYPECIAVSASQVLVTGRSQSGRDPNYFDATTVVYEASTGEESWTATVAHNRSSDIAGSCAVAPDGAAFYVAGLHRTGLSRASAFTIGYAATSGLVLWSRRYDGTRSSWESAHALSISPDGSRLYVTGVTNVRGTEDYLTLAYDSNSGVLIWRRIHSGRLYEYPFGLAVAPDGETVLVSGDAGGRFMTLAYSADGVELWGRTFNPPGQVSFRSIALAADGSAAYITGWHENNASTIAYEVASGRKIWTRSDPSVEPHTILSEPAGMAVYLAGTTQEDSDYFVAAIEV